MVFLGSDPRQTLSLDVGVAESFLETVQLRAVHDGYNQDISLSSGKGYLSHNFLFVYGIALSE